MKDLKTRYNSIDFLKFSFAILIPLLHIKFESDFLFYITQYVSRLGVPIFFTTTGFFVSKKLGDNNFMVCKKYFLKYIKLWLVWLIIYSPIWITVYMNENLEVYDILKRIIFSSPGFLWYLNATAIAIIPFCLINNRKYLFNLAIIFYIFGTLFGGNYLWLTENYNFINNYIYTTRNGLLFGLLFLVLGEKVNKITIYNNKIKLLLGALIILFAEITILNDFVNLNDDRSMYFTLPIAIFFILNYVKQLKVKIIMPNFLLKSTELIYLFQYGIITTLNFVLMRSLSTNKLGFIIWIILVLVSIFVGKYGNNKILKLITS